MNFVDADNQIRTCAAAIIHLDNFTKTDAELVAECKDFILMKHANLANYPVLDAEILANIHTVKVELLRTSGWLSDLASKIEGFFGSAEVDPSDKPVVKRIGAEILQAFEYVAAKEGEDPRDAIQKSLDKFNKIFESRIADLKAADMSDEAITRYQAFLQSLISATESLSVADSNATILIGRITTIIHDIGVMSHKITKDPNKTAETITEKDKEAIARLRADYDSINSTREDFELHMSEYSPNIQAKFKNATRLFAGVLPQLVQLETISRSTIGDHSSAKKPETGAETSTGFSEATQQVNNWTAGSYVNKPGIYHLNPAALTDIDKLYNAVRASAKQLGLAVDNRDITEFSLDKFNQAQADLSSTVPQTVLNAATYLEGFCSKMISPGFKMNDQKQANNFVKAVKVAVRKATEAVSKLKLGKPEGVPAAKPSTAPVPASSSSLSPETKSVKPEVAQPASKPAAAPAVARSEAQIREAETKRLMDKYLTHRIFKNVRKVGPGATRAEVAQDILANVPQAESPQMKSELLNMYKYLRVPEAASAQLPAAAESVAKPVSPSVPSSTELAKEIFKGNYSKADEFNKMFAPVTVEDIKNLDNRVTAGIASQLSWVSQLDEASVRSRPAVVISKLSKTVPIDEKQKRIITTIFNVIAASKKDKAKPVESKLVGK
mgnify:CR=1 FL=1